MKKLLTILIGTLLMIFGCKPENDFVIGVQLDQTQLRLSVGETGTAVLTATVLPESAAARDISWQTTDDAVVFVTPTGNNTAEVRAVGAGTAAVSVTTQEGGFTAVCAVTVEAPLSAIRLNIDRLYLPEGTSQGLTVSRVGNNPEEPLPDVRWRSGDEAVAVVNDYGTVTAANEGETQIEASVVTREGETLTAVCHVTVTATGATETPGGLVYAVMFDSDAVDAAVGDRLSQKITVYPPEAAERLILTADEGLTVYGVGNVTVDRLGVFRLTAEVDGITDTLTVTAVSFEGPEFRAVTALPLPTEENKALSYRLTLTDTALSGKLKAALASTDVFPFDLIAPNAESVADEAFAGVAGLKSVRLEKAERVGSFAFAGCTGLTSIEAPLLEDATGEALFQGCSALTAVRFPELRGIRAGIFDGCTALREMELGFSVASFSGLFGDSFPETLYLKLPNVRSVDSDDFAGCDWITGLELPAAETVEALAFSDCSSLEKLVLGVEKIDFTDQVSTNLFSFFNFFGSTDSSVPNSLTELSFPRLKSVGDNTFAGLSRLRKIDLPQVSEIGERAFYSCVSLTDVNCPKVEILKEEAFKGCHMLRDIDCSQVTSVGSRAFEDCYDLKHLLFSSLQELQGDYAFSGCKNLLLEFPGATLIDFRFFSASNDNDFYSKNFSLTIRLPAQGAFYIAVTDQSEEYLLNFNTLYLHESQEKGVNGLTWQQRTWKQIFFVDDNGNVVP